MKKAGQTHGTQVFGFKREGMADLVLAGLHCNFLGRSSTPRGALDVPLCLSTNFSLLRYHFRLPAARVIELLRSTVAMHALGRRNGL